MRITYFAQPPRLLTASAQYRMSDSPQIHKPATTEVLIMRTRTLLQLHTSDRSTACCLYIPTPTIIQAVHISSPHTHQHALIPSRAPKLSPCPRTRLTRLKLTITSSAKAEVCAPIDIPFVKGTYPYVITAPNLQGT